MKYPHWQYFLSIESEIINISKYIEIHNNNYGTYSIELVKLILSICSEIDVVAKLLCKKVDLKMYNHLTVKKNANISIYRTIICKHFPKLYNANVKVLPYNIPIYPWIAFRFNKRPKWWSGYNDVKHERNINFKKANLRNVVFSAAGLMILLVHLYGYNKPILFLNPLIMPKLFKIEDKYHLYQGIEWACPHLGVPEDLIGP